VRRNRFIYFFISIGVGIILGGLFGWFLRPAEAKNSSFESLRSDYQTDYVLMVAEIFKAEGDIALAKSQLNIIGDEHPITLVQRALENARLLNYSSEDINLIIELGQKLQEVTPDQEEES
jgi:hypothetical protein